jgi:hypothetical protein
VESHFGQLGRLIVITTFGVNGKISRIIPPFLLWFLIVGKKSFLFLFIADIAVSRYAQFEQKIIVAARISSLISVLF